jgi:hypothetical protein
MEDLRRLSLTKENGKKTKRDIKSRKHSPLYETNLTRLIHCHWLHTITQPLDCEMPRSPKI